MKKLEIYRVEKKQNNFYKYVVIIMVTIIATIFVEREITKANEIDDFASKLSYEKVENNYSGITKENSEGTLNFDSVLDGTVGISLIKPYVFKIYKLMKETLKKTSLREEKDV